MSAYVGRTTITYGLPQLITKFRNIMSKNKLFLQPDNDFVTAYKNGVISITSSLAKYEIFVKIMDVFKEEINTYDIRIDKDKMSEHLAMRRLDYKSWIYKFNKDKEVLRDGPRVLAVLMSYDELDIMYASNIADLYCTLILIYPPYLHRNTLLRKNPILDEYVKKAKCIMDCEASLLI